MTDSLSVTMNRGFLAGWIDRDALRSGAVAWSGVLPADPAAWDVEGLALAEAPRLSYRAEAGHGDRVRVRGRLEVTLLLECRRCLSAMERELGIEFEYRFDPAVEPADEEEGLFGLDPSAASVDLFGPLREELVLALPEFPECRVDCRGLCPLCGADRNVTECGCSREEMDARWGPLRDIVPNRQPSAEDSEKARDGEETQDIGHGGT